MTLSLSEDAAAVSRSGRGREETLLRDTRAVRLMELLSALPGADGDRPAADPEIRRVVHDSRRVEPGDLFVAIRGEKADGLAHVPGGARAAAPRGRRGAAGAGAARRVPWVRVPERAPGARRCSRRGWRAIRRRSSCSPA